MSNTESSPSSAEAKSAAEAKAAREKIPKQIGKYQLVRQLGAGGMGAVFLAQDVKTHRSVALKVLPREKASNKTLVKRFRAEAQAAATLEHENIVRVYEADEANGYLYIALEYVDGTDVNCILKKRERMPVKRTIEIVRQVALALQHAHEQNIVHRDIKPSNLMVRKDGVVKLTDLGLARSIDESTDTNITRAGTTVGTVDYMAPEQARHSRLADIRSDLYSLGCTWYQMLVGHPPYHEGSMTNKLQAHATARLPDPRDENPEVPESIVMMIQRLMAKKPEDRYQTPQELLDDLANSHLHRKALSDHLFSALASSEDSRTDVPAPETPAEIGAATPAYSRSIQKQAKGEGLLIPPRDDSRAGRLPSAAVETDGSSASELMKYVLMAAGGIGTLVAIWYIVSSLASGISDGGNPGIGESQRHIADEMLNNSTNSAPVVSPRRQTPVPVTQQQPQQTANSNTAEMQEVRLTWPERPLPSKAVSEIPLLSPELDLKVPKWAEGIPMPDEVERLFGDWKPKVVTVGQWQNKIGSHSSLNAALMQAGGENLWVRLIGPGPFVLNPVRFKGKNLILSSDDRAIEPIVLCLAHPQEPAGEFLSLENGSLLLTGVNFVTAAHQFPSDRAVSLISLTRGDLYARDVTLTLYGKRSSPTTAVSMRGKPNDESARVLFDRSLIRGAWTALDMKQDRFSALLANSLVLSNGVPAVSLTGAQSASESEQTLLDPKSRWLRLLQSTIVSSGPCVSVSVGEPPSPPIPATIDVEYSILAATQENSSALLSLANWPVENGHPVKLFWEQDQSVIAGWKSLASAGTPGFQPVSDVNGWNTFWNSIFSDAEFVSETLPQPQPLASPLVDPEQWRWAGSALPRSNLAGFPGGVIRWPAGEQQTTASSLTRFDLSRPAIIAREPVETIELDLDRINLQQRLSQKDWKSGTRFLLSGTKPHMLTPIVIDGRSLTLQSAPDQPDAFRLEPRGSQKDPLISVRNGSLRLSNIRLKIPNRTRDPAPKWAVQVSNGSLMIEDSLLEGPYIANENHSGLVRWETGGSGRSLRADSPHRHLCILDSSYLTTFGTALSLDPQQGLVSLWDTTLAVDGTAVALRFEPDRGATTIDFRKSTLTASQSIFSIAGSVNNPLRPVANCILQECVFAAPLPGTSREVTPTLLEAAPEWIDRSRILWWEKANAYSTELTCFIRPAEGKEIKKSLDDWRTTWGLENIQKPLNTPDGVLLKEEYPVRASIPPEFFQLDAKSRALTWAPDGAAVGATPADYVFLNNKQEEKKDKKPPRPSSNF